MGKINTDIKDKVVTEIKEYICQFIDKQKTDTDTSQIITDLTDLMISQIWTIMNRYYAYICQFIPKERKLVMYRKIRETIRTFLWVTFEEVNDNNS